MLNSNFPRLNKYILPFFLTICLSVLNSCDFPYAPEEVKDVHGGKDNTSSGSFFKLYEINKGMQICNPSISQDETNYPGCMLWLGFSGELNVDTSEVIGYSLPAREHDRLNISDKNNRIKWYIRNTELGLSSRDELQDPEWSTHPGYITFLAKSSSKYDGIAVRLSDKNYIRLIRDSLTVTATPHIYIADTAVSNGAVSSPEYYDNGFIKKTHVKEFFGTEQVKFVWSEPVNGMTIYCIDYSRNNPEPFRIKKPEGKEDWTCESALISKDGNWITYNCFSSGSRIPCIQKLNSTSVPLKAAEQGYAPHWWTDPNTGENFLIYTLLESDPFITADLTVESMQDGSAGTTFKVRLSGSLADVPSHMGPVPAGSAVEICPLPLKGGMSGSGNYMCTGYSRGYIIGL